MLEIISRFIKNEAKEFKEQLDNLYQYSSLKDYIGYENYDEENSLYYSKNSIGFCLECTPLVGTAVDVVDDFNIIFNDILPDDSHLQFMLVATNKIGEILDHWMYKKKSKNLISAELTEQRYRYLADNLNEQTHLARNFKLYISFSKNIEHLKQHYQFTDIAENIAEILKQITGIFNNVGLAPKILKPNGLIDMVRDILCFTPAVHYPESNYNPYDSLRKQMTDNNYIYNIDADGIDDNNQNRIEVYKASTLPQSWSISQMIKLISGDSEFRRIASPFALHLGVSIPAKSNSKALMLAKAAKIERAYNSPLRKFIPSLKDEAEEWGEFRSRIIQNERVVKYNLNFILYGPKKLVDNSRTTLKTAYGRLGWGLLIDKYLQMQSLIASLPMMYGEVGKIHQLANNFRTSPAGSIVNLLPLESEWKGSNIPLMLLVGRRGQLINWNPFDNDQGNYNVITVGKSGSGKSVNMQEMVSNHWSNGGRVFIIDVGRSFEKLTTNLSGKFIEFKADKQICLNPFTTIDMNNQDEIDSSAAMISSVIATMVAPINGVDDLENAMITKAVQQVIKQQGNNGQFDDIFQILSNEFNNQKAQELATRLFPYSISGNYGHYFNGKASLDFTEQLITFEFEELKERKDLQTVVVQMYMVNIANQLFLGDRSTPTIITIDEAWDVLRGKQTGDFVEAFSRKLRKNNAALITGTQSLNDYFKGAASEAVHANSDWACYLSQKSGTLNGLVNDQKIDLDSGVIKIINGLKSIKGQYSEILIKGPAGHSVMRLYLDNISKTLYSTAADEYVRVQDLQREGLSLIAAIKQVSEERYGSN
jgi:conjugal transfer ATP-binding protein TraC